MEDIDLIKKMRLEALSVNPEFRKYMEIRKLHGNVLDSMFDYFDEDDHHKPYFEYLRNLADDMWLHKRYPGMQNALAFTAQEETDWLVKMLLYFGEKDGMRLADFFLKEKKYDNPEEEAMLNAIKSVRYIRFQVVDSAYGTASVTIRDIKSGEELKIMDTGLSFTYHSAEDLSTEMVIFAAVFTYDGITYLDSSVPVSVRKFKVTKLLNYLDSTELHPLLEGALAFHVREHSHREELNK